LNLSFEGAELKLSYRFFDWLRSYAGGTYLFDRDPSDLKPWVAQAGIEGAHNANPFSNLTSHAALTLVRISNTFFQITSILQVLKFYGRSQWLA
jgi:Protein of unknown function (DUF1207)